MHAFRLAVAIALGASLFATRAAIAGDDAAAIKTELSREVSAWNAGDLAGYLAGYERAATTTMIGRTQLYRGWDAIAAMYRARFGDRKRMGTLAFSELEVRPLAPDYALAIGRWDLQRGSEGGGPVGGFFTLTLHKSVAGWHIVLDHTS
jgi:ketosteroid isomerase-like protein